MRKGKYEGGEVINASEIGQFHYCSIAWYLQKKGYKPKSSSLKEGSSKHKQLGDTIDYTVKQESRSKKLAIAGYILLSLSILIIIFEVI